MITYTHATSVKIGDADGIEIVICILSYAKLETDTIRGFIKRHYPSTEYFDVLAETDKFLY